MQLKLIQPGKPTHSTYIERFNGKFRDECLNAHWLQFDWHVDTKQIPIAPGLIHFVEPTGRTVGIKVLQQAAEIRHGGAA